MHISDYGTDLFHQVAGHLDERWSAWFDGLTITNELNGEAVLSGVVPDQAALHGVLTRIRDLGLPLLGITQRRDDDDELR